MHYHEIIASKGGGGVSERPKTQTQTIDCVPLKNRLEQTFLSQKGEMVYCLVLP